jgi:oligoribonuclease
MPDNPSQTSHDTRRARSDQNLVWLDCEMTGLDPEVDRHHRDRGGRHRPASGAAHGRPGHRDPPERRATGQDGLWNKGTHGRSGLTDKVKASTLSRKMRRRQQIIAFLSKYVPKGVVPMCGNTIGQDRRFLVKYMPKLEAFFHYRNIDVSTLKELAKRWRPEIYNAFKKQQKHTALADVHESIDELAHYRKGFLRLTD